MEPADETFMTRKKFCIWRFSRESLTPSLGAISLYIYILFRAAWFALRLESRKKKKFKSHQRDFEKSSKGKVGGALLKKAQHAYARNEEAVGHLDSPPI